MAKQGYVKANNFRACSHRTIKDSNQVGVLCKVTFMSNPTTVEVEVWLHCHSVELGLAI